MLKLYSLVFILFIIVGCHHNVQPQKVVEYVDRAVYCADLPEQKEYATDNLSKNDSYFKKTKALLIEKEQREITEEELRAIIKGCSEPEGEQ